VSSGLEQVRLECIAFHFLGKKTYDLFIQELCKIESVKVMPKEANYSVYEGSNGLAKVIESQFWLVEVAYGYTCSIRADVVI
jgi:hypothetical protein